MFALLRSCPPAIPARQPLITLQQRGVKRTKITRKPSLLPLKFNEHGQPRPIEKIRGYGPDEVNRFNSWLKAKALTIAQALGTNVGGRFVEELEDAVYQYVETDWGIKMSLLKSESRRRRAIRVKARKNRKLRSRLDVWNKLEDMRENKVLRDRRRDEREARKEPFSWPAFLRAEREKRRHPYVIEDEETFRKRLEEDQQKFLFNGPKVLFRKRRGTVGYQEKLYHDVFEPWQYELRRRGRISELVNEREDAIARAKWIAQNEERKAKRLEERKENFMAQLNQWNSVMGRWWKENNELRMAKLEYMKQREEVLSLARKEYLQALQDEHQLWENSPNECRFLRFRFVEGVKFPYNKTDYI